MAIASVASLLDLLRQLQLLEPEQIAELDRISGTRFTDARGLAGELVRRGWLTPYQVNQLFQGRGQQLILGSFVLLERLGEGGMGQVFKARHRKLGRIVALKLIRKQRLDNPDAVRRFRREIEAASKLTHPNIVLALDADEVNDTHFFAMEYVEGIDLAKYIKQQGPLPVETACAYIRQAALGLQHAYERGMVHRDIKPHNLLLTAQTSTIKVLDMGLARLHSETRQEKSSTSLTEEGAVMGTPDYIAPEQARDSRSADIRADLYSLGCTSYFLLTGQVPFPGGSLLEKLFRHQTEPPRSLLEFRPDLPRPVSAVIHRLLAKNPRDRFQTPAEFIAALDAAQDPSAALAAVPVDTTAQPETVSLPATHSILNKGRPHLEQVKARQAVAGDSETLSPGSITSPFADLRPNAKRAERIERPAEQETAGKRVLLYSAAGGCALLALVLILVSFFRRGSTDHSAPETAPSSVGESARTEASEKEWKALLARGKATGADRTKLRNEVIAFGRRHAGTRSAREAAEWLKRLPSPLDRWTVTPLSPLQKLEGQPKELLTVLGDHRSWVGHAGGGSRMYVQHSSDGRWLACNTGDGTIRLLNPDDLTVKAVLKAEEPQGPFDFRRDGKRIVTSGRTSVVLWDLSGDHPQQIRAIKGFPGSVGPIALSPDGKRLAIPCGTEPPTVRLWDISGEPKEIAVLRGHTSGICKPAFAPDGKTLATGSADKTIHIWDLSTEQPRERAILDDHTYWVVSVTFSPDGKLLASSGQHDNTVRLWDMTVAQPKELTGGQWLSEATNDTAFSPDGKRLACGFWGGEWRLWDVLDRQLRPIAQVPDHSTIVWAVSFAPDGRTLATASRDGTVHLWSVQELPPRQRMVGPGHGQPITGLGFTPDDGTLVSLSGDGTARLWDVLALRERERISLPVQLGHVSGALHPDGRTLVTSDSSNKRVYWDIASGKELRSVPGRGWRMAFRPDGKMLVGTTDDYTVTFWDAESGQIKRIERGEPNVAMLAVAISPDGRRVAVSDNRGFIHLWNTGDTREHRSCKTPEGCASVLSFSTDSKTLAAAGKDGRMRLFDVTSCRERASLPAHEKDTTFLAYSLDGKQLISAGMDGRILLRDTSDDREQRLLKMPVPITAAALTGDGRHLAVGHVDGTISVLRLAAPSAQ